jgi:hypothetical protein
MPDATCGHLMALERDDVIRGARAIRGMQRRPLSLSRLAGYDGSPSSSGEVANLSGPSPRQTKRGSSSTLVDDCHDLIDINTTRCLDRCDYRGPLRETLPFHQKRKVQADDPAVGAPMRVRASCPNKLVLVAPGTHWRRRHFHRFFPERSGAT